MLPGIEYEKDNGKIVAKSFEEKCDAFLTAMFPTMDSINSITNSAPQSQSLPLDSGLCSLSSKGASSKSYK